jgi:UDP-N-acetylglucosamine 2-epimerase (non-hydrolysing)
MFEVLNYYLPQINNSNVLKRLNLEKGKFFVVSAHREENINSDKNFNGLFEALNIIAVKYKFPIIVSTHPRTRKMIEAKNIKVRDEIQFLKPLGFNDYNALQLNAFAVLSDSGTISEESSILNFRALNIREAHERPEAMEQASVMMVGLNPERILQGLSQLKYQTVNEIRNFNTVADYSVPNVSDKVVRIIISYTDYIRKTVWKESI